MIILLRVVIVLVRFSGFAVYTLCIKWLGYTSLFVHLFKFFKFMEVKQFYAYV